VECVEVGEPQSLPCGAPSAAVLRSARSAQGLEEGCECRDVGVRPEAASSSNSCRTSRTEETECSALVLYPGIIPLLYPNVEMSGVRPEAASLTNSCRAGTRNGRRKRGRGRDGEVGKERGS